MGCWEGRDGERSLAVSPKYEEDEREGCDEGYNACKTEDERLTGECHTPKEVIVVPVVLMRLSCNAHCCEAEQTIVLSANKTQNDNQ